MVPPPLDAQEVARRLQNLPSMAPRPCSTNIDAFEDAAVDVLSTIPSAQDEDHGFQGLIQSPTIYALTTNIPWRDWPDPGPTRRGTTINPDATVQTPIQARAAQAVWDAENIQFTNEKIIRQAMIDALNRAMLKAYCRRDSTNNQSIGHQSYKISQEPRDILA